MPTSQALLEHSKQHMLVRLLDNFLRDVIPMKAHIYMKAFWEVPQNKSAVHMGIAQNSNFNRVNEYFDTDFGYDFDGLSTFHIGIGHLPNYLLTKSENRSEQRKIW